MQTNESLGTRGCSHGSPRSSARTDCFGRARARVHDAGEPGHRGPACSRRTSSCPRAWPAALGGGGTVSVDELEVHKVAARGRRRRPRPRSGSDARPTRAEADSDGAGGDRHCSRPAPGASPSRRCGSPPRALGSAISLSSLDGDATSSLFAGASGVSLELRRGDHRAHASRSSATSAEPPHAPAPAVPPPRRARPQPAKRAARARQGDALAAPTRRRRRGERRPDQPGAAGDRQRLPRSRRPRSPTRAAACACAAGS